MFLIDWIIHIIVFIFLISLFYVIFKEKYPKNISIFLSISSSFLIIYFFKNGDWSSLLKDLGLFMLIIFIFYTIAYSILSFKQFKKEEIKEKDIEIKPNKTITLIFLIFLILIFIKFVLTIKFANFYLKLLVYSILLLTLIFLVLPKKKD